MARLTNILGLVGAVALCAAAGGAAAQSIGTAATVRNDVAQVKGAAAAPIVINEEVVRNEVVRTGSDSATKLVFKDNTNLAVGPTSTVTLDRFVFSGDETTASKVSVNLVRGAFRFTTGVSDKKAYEIKTPVATIGVRGTIFNTYVVNGRTFVQLEEGQAIVCTRNGKHCVTLNPGQSVLVTANGVNRLAAGSEPAGLDFAQFCGGDGLCTATQYATLPAGGASFASVLCGR